MFEMLTAVRAFAVQTGEVVAEAGDAAVENAESVTEAVDLAADAATVGGGATFAIFVAGLVGAFVLGAFLARTMKMTDWALRFGVCLAALAFGTMPFLVRAINGEAIGSGLRLGIDLAGGTNMVFQVEPDEEKPLTSAIMDKMVTAVGKRVNPTGTSEITVRQVGSDRIEVIVPGKDPQTVAEIKQRIVRLGSLEFFITANPLFDATIISEAEKLSLNEKKLVTELTDGTKEVRAMWVPAFEKEDGSGRLVPQDLERSDVVTRDVEKLQTVAGKNEKYTTKEYLVLVGKPHELVTGKYLKSANPGIDPQSGRQIVQFRFDARGAFLFGQLTSRYQPQPGNQASKRGLGIVLDGHIYSAPNINAVITDSGVIEGDFTTEEVQELTGVLNAGALEVPINKKPLSEATVDPTLGEDVRNKGVKAIIVAAIVVVVFMLVYYRFAGIVAVVCLLLNMLLVLTIMMSINATFTLPGLAGLVLTIGMAVDANVLIFERMREEKNRGSSLKMAIQNGFGKAFTTIVDANVTTLITAAILYAIGTDTVKGFAVSLFIGILVSMFTALYVGRVLFDVAEQRRLIKDVGMFSLVGQTSLDFLGKRRICAFLSLVLIVGGLAAFVSRGNANYDIDFTGGTMVTFRLEDAAETDDVRDVLATQFEDSFTVERLTLAGDEGSNESSLYFRLRSTESDTEENKDEDKSAEQRVAEKVFLAFDGNESMKLLKVDVTFSDPESFDIADGDESAEAMIYQKFDGGHLANVEFSSEIAAGRIFDMLRSAIEATPGEKYPDATEFIGVEGLAGSGLEAEGQEVQKFNKVAVRITPDVEAADVSAALASLKTTLDSQPLLDEVNTFASAVASEMKTSAIMAIIISLLAIVAYIWFRFQQITFGLAAVVALVHDVLIVLGLMAVASYLSGTAIGDILLLNDFRINLPMVAAFLTIVGYSLNDTIVVFDRIREVRGKNPSMTQEIINTSLNQTLSRTLLTSLTTFIVVVILYAIGGEGIHGFAFCLTLGVIVGTYSSIYVASPVLLWLMNRKAKTAQS